MKCSFHSPSIVGSTVPHDSASPHPMTDPWDDAYIYLKLILISPSKFQHFQTSHGILLIDSRITFSSPNSLGTKNMFLAKDGDAVKLLLNAKADPYQTLGRFFLVGRADALQMACFFSTGIPVNFTP